MRRADRVAEEIKKVVSHLLYHEVKDPRMPDFLTITHVKVTRDLSHATLFYSVMGDEKEKQNGKIALNAANSFLRRELAKNIKLRVTPQLHFKEDNSIEEGMRISRLIDETMKKDAENRAIAEQEEA